MILTFESPVHSKRVRKDVWAVQFKNGVIVIVDAIRGISERYAEYSMTEAINKYRKDFPTRVKNDTRKNIRR